MQHFKSEPTLANTSMPAPTEIRSHAIYDADQGHDIGAIVYAARDIRFSNLPSSRPRSYGGGPKTTAVEELESGLTLPMQNCLDSV